jgi:peptide/nickel transport system ATP-binding protein
VLITHDLGVVAGMADRVLVMYAGRPVEVGTVDEIYYQPRMPYTLGLLGSLPRLDAREKQRLTPIPGSPPSLISPPPGCPFGPRCPLHIEQCDQAEPPLEQVGPDHFAACIRSTELAKPEVAAEDVFEVTAVDDVLGAELASLPEIGEAEPGEPRTGVVEDPNPAGGLGAPGQLSETAGPEKPAEVQRIEQELRRIEEEK